MSSPRTKPTRGRPRTVDPAQVLDVAMTAYWRADPADVSLNAVCRLAGVSKPSLYREFGNEDGLTCAALERYADQVLADVLAILAPERALQATLAALTDFACADPRMETGCLLYKMRSGKHRLGPRTRALVDALDASAQAAYQTYLAARRDAGDWPAAMAVEAGARYLNAQVSLAISQRAAGEDVDGVRDTLTLALSVFTRP